MKLFYAIILLCNSTLIAFDQFNINDLRNLIFKTPTNKVDKHGDHTKLPDLQKCYILLINDTNEIFKKDYALLGQANRYAIMNEQKGECEINAGSKKLIRWTKFGSEYNFMRFELLNAVSHQYKYELPLTKEKNAFKITKKADGSYDFAMTRFQ
jgi:hypothetical protein